MIAGAILGFQPLDLTIAVGPLRPLWINPGAELATAALVALSPAAPESTLSIPNSIVPSAVGSPLAAQAVDLASGQFTVSNAVQSPLFR